MRRKNRRTAPPRPQLPTGIPVPSPEDEQRVNAATFGYLKRVLVDGERPACAPETAAALAGMILGQRVGLLQLAEHMTPDLALAAGARWVAETAARYPEQDRAGDALAMPSQEAMEAAAARYVAGVMDGSVPRSCPPWMPAALAAMCSSALVAGFAVADGLDDEAATAATRARLAVIAEGNH